MTSEPKRTARTRPEPTLPEGTNTEALHHRINRWFLDQARDLPWRRDECTPWGVMVSEFMLQQTPVKRVLPVWEEWMRRWPTPADLAAEPASEAVRAWGRLGYPRRAQRLHSAAVAIVEQHGGEVPADYEALLALPGVGSYTAAAISVFAFGLRATVIDTNIRRVHARAVSGKALPSRSLTAAETRLVRGAVMAVLRAAHEPVNRELILSAGVAAAGDTTSSPVAASSPDFTFPADAPAAVHRPLKALYALSPAAEQLQRCYAGLLADSLAREVTQGDTVLVSL